MTFTFYLNKQTLNNEVYKVLHLQTAYELGRMWQTVYKFISLTVNKYYTPSENEYQEHSLG